MVVHVLAKVQAKEALLLQRLPAKSVSPPAPEKRRPWDDPERYVIGLVNRVTLQISAESVTRPAGGARNATIEDVVTQWRNGSGVKLAGS